jgi:exonuclease III
MEPHVLIVGYFHTPFSSMGRSFRQKQTRRIMKITDIMNEMDLIDIYRTFHTNTKEYTLASTS